MRMQQKAEVAASVAAVELASCRDVAGSNARWTAKGWMVLTRYPSFVWRGQIVISLVIVIRSLSFISHKPNLHKPQLRVVRT